MLCAEVAHVSLHAYPASRPLDRPSTPSPSAPIRRDPAVAAQAGPRTALPLRALALACAALIAVLSLGTAGAQEAVQEQVRVSGSGVVYGEPDQAVLELGVEATDPDARTVIDATSEAMTALQAALQAMGVDERDIRTVVFDLYREEPYGDDGEPQPVRYRLIHLVEVTVRDVDAVGDLLAAAVEAGADRVGGVRFGLSDASELEAQARRVAVENARAKAEDLAEAAGRSVGRALSIDEGGMLPPPQPTESRMMSLDAGGAAPVSAGQLAVRVDVYVVYALE